MKKTLYQNCIRFLLPLFLAVVLLPGQLQKAYATPVGFMAPDRDFTSLALDTFNPNAPEIQRIVHSLDSFYNIVSKKRFNGSVLVGYKGHILYEKYFGYADKATHRMLSPQTPNQLASTSKNFLATAVLWLYQEGYLDIYAPVQTYLKNFPYPKITVKMLMDHRSGLPKYLHFCKRYWSSRTLKSNQDLLRLIVTKKPRLSFSPNSRFQYCNTNYAILACVLEEVTAMPFPKFMKEFIFKPLGLNHTFVYDPLHDTIKHPKRTISYHTNWRPWAYMFADGIYGDKNIYSTPEDLYKWDQSFYHHVLLKPKTLKLAYTGCSPNMKGVRNYGLGWRMLDYPNGYKVIYHNGWWHGNNNVFYRFVRDNFTIIVLGNRYNSNVYDQAEVIYHIIQKECEMERKDVDFSMH